MNSAKIRLSQTEMELVTNAELILTKNAILKKVNQLLGNLQAKQQEYIMTCATGLPVKIAEDALICVAMGAGQAFEDPAYHGVLIAS